MTSVVTEDSQHDVNVIHNRERFVLRLQEPTTIGAKIERKVEIGALSTEIFMLPA